MRRPKIIGITGGIGSGKSTVCKIFETFSFSCYFSDLRAKVLMNQKKTLKEQIVSLFGNKSYVGGMLNRTHVAHQIFDNSALLTQLNSLVHPIVRRDFARWVSQHSNEPVLIKEAALIIESKQYENLDQLILVKSSTKSRIKRILKRDPHRTKKEILNIMERQFSDLEKEKYADHIILNDENHSLIEQTWCLYQKNLKTWT